MNKKRLIKKVKRLFSRHKKAGLIVALVSLVFLDIDIDIIIVSGFIFNKLYNE